MVIHGDKLRWLFWMRRKMFLRNFTRGSGRVSYIIGTILQLFFGLLIGGGIGIGSYFAYRYLPSPANAEVLFLVLTGSYLYWLILPLLTFNTNEGLDISKLALFPLTRGELMASLLLSTLLDIPTLGLFLVLAAVVVGWAFSLPLVLFGLLTVLIFYAQIIGMSQFILALLARILQSRRFRDLSIILIVLLTSSCYFFEQLAARSLRTTDLLGTLKQAPFSNYLQWLPPGMAARAIEQASLGNWGISFAWLAALSVVTFVVLYLWQMVVERGLTSTEGVGTAKVRRRGQQPALEIATVQASSGGLWERILPAQVRAITIKDLKYYRRDPQLLAMVIRSFVTIGIFLFALINAGANRGTASHLTTIGPWLIMIAPLCTFFSLSILSTNIFGFERQSLTTLVLFPLNPKRVLWGKNIALLLIGVVEILLVILIAVFLFRAWDLALPTFVAGLAFIGIVLSIGNFTSVFLPTRMPAATRGFQFSATNSNVSTQAGCLRGVMSLVSLVVMLILLIPVALALALPVILSAQWLWIITLPLALVYGGAIYFGVTALVAPRLLDRIPEILAAVVKE